MDSYCVETHLEILPEKGDRRLCGLPVALPTPELASWGPLGVKRGVTSWVWTVGGRKGVVGVKDPLRFVNREDFSHFAVTMT